MAQLGTRHAQDAMTAVDSWRYNVPMADSAGHSANLRRLELQVARTNTHWRTMRSFLLAVAAFIIVVAAARQIWFLVAIGAVMFAGFLAISQSVIARTSWETNPLLQTLRERPQDITQVKHHVATSSSGAFAHSFFVISNGEGKRVSLRVPNEDKPEITLALRECCPNAEFTGPGFE